MDEEPRAKTQDSTGEGGSTGDGNSHAPDRLVEANEKQPQAVADPTNEPTRMVYRRQDTHENVEPGDAARDAFRGWNQQLAPAIMPLKSVKVAPEVAKEVTEAFETAKGRKGETATSEADVTIPIRRRNFGSARLRSGANNPSASSMDLRRRNS